MSTDDRCGYAVTDDDGELAPCDRPATGWRWYQDCEHEDMLDRACDWHENEGGNRLAAVEAERDKAQEHIARWLDENPPLSTAERVERGLTGDLSMDMMRYATRLKGRADKAEAERDRLAAAVERVEAIAFSDESNRFRDEAAQGTVALPYASDRYLYLLDCLRAALSDAGRGK